MASEPSSVDQTADRQARGGVAGGILLALFGVLALFTPFVTGIALSLLLGAALTIGTVIHAAAAFSGVGFWASLWQILLALIYAVAAFAILTNPIVGLTTITILIIGFFLASGVVQLFWAVTGGEGSRLWFALSGAVALLLAVLLWANFPTSAIWLAGTLLGVNFLFTGVAMVVHGRSGRVEATERPAGAD
ncbi:HdeD family acid-resistance protein [Halobacteriales archaeon Cl-PHB]